MNLECRTGHINCTKCKLSKNPDTTNICYTFNKGDYLQNLEAIFGEFPRFYDNLKNATIIEVQYDDESRAGKTQYDNGKYTVLINTSQLKKEAQELGRDYQEYFYETLFHEYTHTLSMNNQQLKEDYSDENIRGFTLLFEYFAQTIAQKIISLRYNKIYPEKDCKLEFKDILNTNRSDLFWYGEIEPFALKFSELLYGTKDGEKMINDYLNGKIYDLIKEKIQQNPEFIKHLNDLGIIIAGNYIQQGYIKEEEYKNRINKESFGEAIRSFQN